MISASAQLSRTDGQFRVARAAGPACHVEQIAGVEIVAAVEVGFAACHRKQEGGTGGAIGDKLYRVAGDGVGSEGQPGDNVVNKAILDKASS